MWTRKEVKETAKAALKRNYWKVVLVSMLFLMLGVGGHSAAKVSRPTGSANDNDETNVVILENDGDFVTLEDYVASEGKEAFISEVMSEIENSLNERAAELKQVNVVVWIVFLIVFFTIFFIIAAIATALDIFVINPLYVGVQRFMLKCVDGTGYIAELGYTFDHNYKNGVKTTFFRDLHIVLWSLLLIIPGIYKKYQYYMVDYILAENPDMPYREVLECSKKMMDGHKWHTFVLDISFILWHMLSVMTCGILEFLYVAPYVNLTRASLYRTLQERKMATQEREVIFPENVM